MLISLCREKVLITQYKGFILLEGEGAHKTLIKWGDYNNDKSNHTTVSSATFSSYATNFVARDISFKVLFFFFFLRIIVTFAIFIMHV